MTNAPIYVVDPTDPTYCRVHCPEADMLTVVIAGAPTCRFNTPNSESIDSEGHWACGAPATCLAYDTYNAHYRASCAAHAADWPKPRSPENAAYEATTYPVRRLPHADALERLMARLKTLTEPDRIYNALLAAFDAKLKPMGLAVNGGPYVVPPNCTGVAGPTFEGRIGTCVPCKRIEDVDAVADILSTTLADFFAKVVAEMTPIGPVKLTRLVNAHGWDTFGWMLPVTLTEGETR